MLEFVRISFRVVISITLWIVLISCPILGFFMGSATGDNAAGILGAIIGLIVGGFSIVISGGYIATILNIDENLQKIADRYEGNSTLITSTTKQKSDNNAEISYEDWKKKNPGKSLNDYYSSHQKGTKPLN